MGLNIKYEGIFTAIVLILIIKYIYRRELKIDKRGWIIIVASYIVCNVLYNLFVQPLGIEDLEVLLPVLFSSFVSFLTNQNKRIKGALMVIPAIFTALVPYTFIILLISFFTDRSITQLLEMIMDSVMVFAIGVIIYKEKKLEYPFKISTMESLIIAFTSIMISVTFLSLEMLQDTDQLFEYEKQMILFILLAIMILVPSIGVAVVKSKLARYYKNLTQMNAYYMKAQLEHFESYKLTQNETRRIKHDIKNHMLCIRELSMQEKYDQLQKYVDSLSEVINSVDSYLHTGNDIADAIINEKNSLAKKLNITISVDGTLAGIASVSPMDMCTLFSNAIDNAMQACTQLPENIEKYICITIKRDRNYLLITFVNPLENQVSIKNNIIETTKKDKGNHGFGLENINNTLKKYHGEMLMECEEMHSHSQQIKAYQFRLQLMLLV